MALDARSFLEKLYAQPHTRQRSLKQRNDDQSYLHVKYARRQIGPIDCVSSHRKRHECVIIST